MSENLTLVSASAPGRCGILGNPSDIYGGKVLSCSIPARARCNLTVAKETNTLPDPRLWNAAKKRFPELPQVTVSWETDIPRSSGLSGSTALLAATLGCVLRLVGKPVDLATVEGRSNFAELVRDVERYDAEIVCGYQDAYMIVHGGMQLMDFAGKHPRVPGPQGQLREIKGDCRGFLLITTGVERLSGSVHGPMAERWMNGEPAVRRVIERISQLAEPGAKALVENDLNTLSILMNENHGLIAEVGGSGDAIDRLISDCLQSGASAAKLAGAGMGGTVIALCDDRDELQNRLQTKGYSKFMRPQICDGFRYEYLNGN